MDLVVPRKKMVITLKHKPIDSPIKYHGGKSYLAKWIVGLMPEHVTYVEPYFGGGSVLLAKPYKDIGEIANDIDGNLMTFFRVLSKPELFEKFSRRIALLPFSELLWEQSRDLLASDESDEVERAMAFFVLNRQSHAGRMKDFAALTTNRTRRGMNEQASAWLSAVDRLPAVHARLKRVAIVNRPAIDVIQDLDGPNVLFYLDPPYPQHTRAAKSVYRFEMSVQDHKQLLQTILACKGKVMLSGYRDVLYSHHLRDWRRVDREIPNHAAGGAKKRIMTESVWMNF